MPVRPRGRLPRRVHRVMAAAALTSAMLPIGQVSAAPMTFVVVTLQDVDGMCTPTQCSLRQAINSANKNPGRDTIAFSFTGDAIPHTIQPTKELPPIKQPVVIDGTTEPSYVLYGHPVVEIDGSRAPANASGLRITGGGSEIRGLVINRFGTRGVSSAGGSAIVIEKIGGNVIEGNYLGTDVFGHGDRGNRLAGVSIQRSSDNRIGGPAAEERNVIAANGTGVAINGQGGVATRNAVIGNYIGVDAEGDDKLGNEIGVDINQAAVNTIGGPGAGNVISANAGAGVEVRGTGSQRNVIAGNLIGTDAAGTASFGNFRGVFFTSGALDNVVGGTATGAGNLIAFNSETGVLVPETGKQRSVQIEILGNSIHSNGIPGLSGLGIDLTPEGGVTPNDATDADLGGNRLMNFPVLTSAVSTATGTTIEGTLTSEASRSYRVELFASPTCDANGHGEGRDFLGAQSVTTDASGNATLSFTAAASVTPGWFITATSTEEAFGNTSEFSACLAVNAPPFVQADGGSLTLGGEPWYLYGASAYLAVVPGGSGDLDQVIDWSHELGLNTIRLANYLDERGIFADAPYSETEWTRVDDMIARLGAADLHVILDLSVFRNHVVNHGVRQAGWEANCVPGGDRTPVDYGAISPYRADLFDEWDAWMGFVANRVNTVTGVAYRDDPTIAMVSIAGEPGPPNSEECGMASSTAELTDFFAHTMAEWQDLDPNHLVSNGGFLHLDWEELYGNPAGSGIDWQAIFSDPANDVPSIHTYVNYPVPMDDPPVPFTEYQTGKIAPFVAALGKPWITEEFGFPQRDPDPGRAVYYAAVYQLQRDHGSAGVAFWSLGHELHPNTFDVNPDTPQVWQVIGDNAP